MELDRPKSVTYIPPAPPPPPPPPVAQVPVLGKFVPTWRPPAPTFIAPRPPVPPSVFLPALATRPPPAAPVPPVPAPAAIRPAALPVVGRIATPPDPAPPPPASAPNPFVAFGGRFVDSVTSGNISTVADTLRGGIDDLVAGGRQGISDASAWSVAAVHDVSDLARSKVGGDDPLSAFARGAIDTAEGITRFQIGATGGILKEATSLVGTVGSLAVTAGEMQASPTATIDNGQRMLNAGLTATDAVSGYLSSVAADPSRITRDVGDLVQTGLNAAGDKLGSYGTAIEEGRFEAIGNDVGVVATYVVPVGGGPARSVLGTVGRETTQAVGETVAARAPRLVAPAITHPLAGFSKEEVISMTIAEGVATAPHSAVLWSGLGETGAARAEAFVATAGGKTLEMTPGGRWLANQRLGDAGTPFTRAEQLEIWGAVSKEFVNQASGQVRSLVGGKTLNPTTVYYQTELAAARANEAITGIDQFVIGPASPGR